MDFVIGRRSQREHAIDSVRVRFNRPAGVRFHVAYEYTGACQRLAAEILNQSVDVLRLRAFIAPSRRNAELSLGRQSRNSCQEKEKKSYREFVATLHRFYLEVSELQLPYPRSGPFPCG